MRRHVSLLRLIGLAGLLEGGCANESMAPSPPAMPRVVPGIARVTVDPDDAVTRAAAAALHDDLAGAIATIGSVAESQRAPAFHQLAIRLAREDPGRAERFARALPTGDAQNDTIAVAAQTMFARDRGTAVTWAASLQPAGLRHVALATLADVVTAEDPRAGVHWIDALPDQPSKPELLQLVAAAWTRRDANAALGWANSLTGDRRIAVTTAIAFELAQSDPERAAEIARTLPEDRNRWLLLSAIAQTWTARNPAAAQAWVRSLPPGPAHDAAISGIASATGPIHSRRSVALQGQYRSPARLPGGGASAGDVTALPPGLQRRDALRREFEHRLQEGPARAAQWLATLPAPDVTDDMLLRLARDWFRQDPNAATTWLETTVSSPIRREQIRQEARQ